MRFPKVRAGLGAILAISAVAGCKGGGPELAIDYEMYQLENGLTVVLHEDRSDPVTAVAILYHVGSGREEVGKTGFAHLFEHMMFQSSQHVAEGEFIQKIPAAGGMLNGGTSSDQTVYFEVVPKNALEMVLWLESDRMGYLLPTVTTEAFLNQQGVVQNEKRQGVDNRPYGHTSYVIDKLLFPEGHPYNWQVIGSFEDLANATVEDVREFFRTWYGPNNATLVVAGDLDVEQTKVWVEQYFGELPAGNPVPDPDPRNVTLSESVRAFHEDAFARSPELNMVFPTVENFTDDAYALSLFGQLFSQGKKAPLYQVIVEEQKLAPSVSAYNRSREVAGSFGIRVRAFPEISLDRVEAAIGEAFSRFEAEGFTEEDLDRIKARTETNFYNGISSVLGKSFQLASYAEFAGSPGYMTEDIRRSLAVTSQDVWRVYETYIKGRPFVLTSFVPRGQTHLVAEGSERFSIPADPEGLVSAAAGVEVPVVEPLPSSFDRSAEPAKGPPPSITLPTVWTHTYENGLRLFGIEQHEVPLVQFTLVLKGGVLKDDLDQVGVANLVSQVMMEGTATRTPLELEEAIEGLGARLTMRTGRQSITLSGNGLRSKAGEIVALAQEVLLEPRWDETELARIKDETIETINRQSVNPASVATNVFNRVVYGAHSVLGRSSLGTRESVAAITVDDLRAYYEANFSPSAAHLAVAGDITQAEAVELFRPLEASWPAKAVDEVAWPEPHPQPRTTLYFVDIPGARQSQIRVGHLGPAASDEDFHAVEVMNYQLGGNFMGVLNMILREEKGFTYGARSGFTGGLYPGTFVASSGVQSTATRESVEIFRDEIRRYRQGISQEDLDFTRNAMILSNALRFETAGALLGMLNTIATYDRPFDYVLQDEQVTRDITRERHQELARAYLHPDRMVFLVVGDAATQRAPLRGLGMGDPVLLDTEGNPVR